MISRLFAKKPISNYQASSELQRMLTTFDLTLMGIGAIIGAGVFVLTGVAAATKAGPAIMFSYMIAGTASMFAALSYAELAASVGGTGSAYSYAYSGFGEIIAWMIGWNLLLEYSMSVATVAIGWSGYVTNFFEAIGLPLPEMLTMNPFHGQPPPVAGSTNAALTTYAGGWFDLPAALIILVLAALLCLGVKHSARINAVIVVVKLATIAFFITIAAFNINSANWHPFMPFGTAGVMSGAALVFFSYIGFDALSTAVEEAIEPQRSIPIAIISSLVICTIIYIIVSTLLTGIDYYTGLDVESPVSDSLLKLGFNKAASIISIGAIAGLTTVMLVMYYGLTRICLAMARDGLLPKKLAVINPNTHTPVRIILIMAVIMAVIAGLTPIDRAAEMVNIGTLMAFIFVCGGVVVLRSTHKDLHRPFRLPYSPLIPILGVLSCFYLTTYLSELTWYRFLIWSIIGITIYFLYGYRHSITQPRRD
jgi:APA family basic amino acid/polyamine antiporter